MTEPDWGNPAEEPDEEPSHEHIEGEDEAILETEEDDGTSESGDTES